MSKNKGVFIGGIIIVGIVIAIVVGVFTGFLYGGIKSPQQQAVIRHVVCDDALINTYNEAFRKEPESARSAALKSVASDIEKRTSYREDPSCVYMAAQSYMQDYDVKKTDELVKAYETLAKKGLYPNPRINNLQGITVLTAQSQIYEKMPQSSPNANTAPGGG